MARKRKTAIVVICTALILPALIEAADLSDPMRPRTYQPPDPQVQVEPDRPRVDTDSWRLTGVLLSAERSVAIINGQSLRVGALLDGYRLVELSADRALLRRKGQRVVLTRAATGLKKQSTKGK